MRHFGLSSERKCPSLQYFRGLPCKNTEHMTPHDVCQRQYSNQFNFPFFYVHPHTISSTYY